ncbi:MAG: ABC transporter substrate-binding protein [Acidimicrobiales bacterium]
MQRPPATRRPLPEAPRGVEPDRHRRAGHLRRADRAAPGITDDTIKIGVTYVDTEALVAVGLDYDLGDHKAVYQALFDDINANGGINDRMIEPVYAAIDPTNSTGADEACLKLTEDDEVFLITGFFLLDAVLCPVDLHETAVVGGEMTPERTAAAKAPWITWTPDTDQPVAIVQALAERGALDGRVAVYAAVADADVMEKQVLPALRDLGIEPVETATMDAPTDDTAALDAGVKLVAEKFKAAEADTILLVGASSATWPQYMADGASYRPQLLFLSNTARAFYTSGATTDTSILDGALIGGPYGPDQAKYDEAAMQECVGVLAEAGLDTPEPKDFDADDQSNQPYQAAFQACPDASGW